MNNWKYIVGKNLFKVCYPKSFRHSNKFGVSTLSIVVKRGHEVDLEYSKKEITSKMNNFFGYKVVEILKFSTIDETNKYKDDKKSFQVNVTNNKYQKKIDNVNNKKIKKSLLELAKVFKKK